MIVRASVPEDANPLTKILNDIIKVGGTTAMEELLSQAEFADRFLHGPDHIICNVAEDTITRQPLGFQVLLQRSDLPDAWADIATFAQMLPKIAGVGSALFAVTRTKASEFGLQNINATIRADNHGGLAYYTKMGFKTYKTIRALPLKNGMSVDRIFKRYELD
ncbi:MAG: GNAT family N-acetyltransferase [Pseudomonadota bacterium]